MTPLEFESGVITW